MFNLATFFSFLHIYDAKLKCAESFPLRSRLLSAMILLQTAVTHGTAAIYHIRFLFLIFICFPYSLFSHFRTYLVGNIAVRPEKGGFTSGILFPVYDDYSDLSALEYSCKWKRVYR